MNKKRLYLAIISVVLIVTTCFSFVGCETVSPENTTTTTTSTTTSSTSPTVQAPSDDSQEKVDITTSTLYLIDLLFQKYSIHDYDYEEALINAVRAYISATGDKYAAYYTPEEWEEQIVENNGDLYGVGVTVVFDYDEYFMEVVSIVPDSPASKHLLVGDKVTHFYDGENYVEIADLVAENIEKYREIYDDEELIVNNAAYDAYQYSISKIKGAEGTLAKIKIERNGETIEKEIERAKVKSISVTYKKSEKDRSVGIVSISSFNMTTPVQFKEAMDSLIEDGIEKFVFDLRHNPGGDLASIVAVLSTLLNEGDTILSTKDTNGFVSTTKVGVLSYEAPDEGEADYRTCNVTAEDIGRYRGYKMVVLVDNDTASAAELFTAALRDYELADIVGVTTYGKGSMQSTIPLSFYGEDYVGALKLTTKLYFPPCGEGYDGGIGIEPDYVVELEGEAAEINFYKLMLKEDIDNQLKKAISLLID